MNPFNTNNNQGGGYAPLQTTSSTAPKSRRKGPRLQKTNSTILSQDRIISSPTSSHSSSSSYSTHSRSSSIHSHVTRFPASSSGSPTQRLYSGDAKSPLLTTPGTSHQQGSPLPYPLSPRYYSLKRCSLIAILATTLIGATFLPSFPSGSNAALNEAGGPNVLNYAASGVGGRTVSGASLGGQWDLIGHSGVSAMHAVMRPFSDSILFLERVQASTFARMQGTSENGNKGEHFAWSTEFSANDGQWRALDVKSNMFCSAGGYLSDGVSRHFLFGVQVCVYFIHGCVILMLYGTHYVLSDWIL